MKLFDTRWWLKPICEKITNHKYNKLVMWSQDLEDRNFKYPSKSEYHYKCKICGYLFWSNRVSKKDLERIKNEKRRYTKR